MIDYIQQMRYSEQTHRRTWLILQPTWSKNGMSKKFLAMVLTRKSKRNCWIFMTLQMMVLLLIETNFRTMLFTDSTQRVPFIKVGSSARYSAICSRDSWNLCFIHWWTWVPGILENHMETRNLTLDFPMVSEVYSLNFWSDRSFKCFQFLLRETYISLIKKETKLIGPFNFYRMK